MRKIEGVIRPHLLEDVKDALWEIGIGGLTVTRVRGYSRLHTRTDSYRGVAYTVDSCPRIKIEVVVTDEDLDRCLSIIRTAALSGKPGDHDERAL
jgi:nitrogen regulatory protein P-II 1